MNEPVSVPKPAIPRSPRRLSVLVGLILGVLLVAGAIGLYAQQKGSAASSLQPSCLTPLVASESSTSAAEAQALLPVIPPQSSPATGGFIGAMPGEPAPSPDRFQTIFGYHGPYYNTSNLDGHLVVLTPSVYTWPTASWKATGLLRNQTRCPVHVNNLFASLIGSQGEVLATAAAEVPVADLRAGEPAPFVIQSPIPSNQVKSVDWHIDYESAQSPSRLFDLQIYRAQTDPDGTYSLFGQIRNDASATSSARIVAAWLDQEGNGKVLYVDSPQMVSISAGAVSASLTAAFSPTTTLSAGATDQFEYDNSDPTLAALLGQARLALWGTSK